MSRYAIIVDRLSDWKWPEDGLQIVPADTYLTEGSTLAPGGRIVNLCRRYTYLSAGYYCSLLAEARGQQPMPTVADVLSLSRKSLYSFALPELEDVLRRTIKRLSVPPEGPFALTVVFGRADDPRFKKLGEMCFDIFRYPILKLNVVRKSRWHIEGLVPLGLHQLPDSIGGNFHEALRAYTRARKPPSGGRPPALYGLAVLHEPEESIPPSDRAALERFVRAGQNLRIDVELITAKDYGRLPEFDALFIRTTTAIDHYTYQFARKAEQEGLVVIDDPASILRCTNKIFVHELMQRHGIATPRSVTIDRLNFDDETVAELETGLGYPVVLKIPDGSFSRGIRKADNRAELVAHATELLKRSRLILAQEYVYTAFDWRVGVLRSEPLYVCQYLMSRKHWQIVNHRADGTFSQGGYKTFAVDQVPAPLVETATRAAALIGDGLYGVDIKETENGFLVIEINDNPSIDHGVEDKVVQDTLYTRILSEFIRRIDEAS